MDDEYVQLVSTNAPHIKMISVCILVYDKCVLSEYSSPFFISTFLLFHHWKGRMRRLIAGQNDCT